MRTELPPYQEAAEAFSPRGRLAIEAALAGGEAVLANSSRNASLKEGGDHNYLTAGDMASEKAVIDSIRARFPDDQILSEESYADLPNPADIDHLWIIDPIDGTFNYARGVDYIGVSVGYAENGMVKAGAIYNPFSRELFFAEEGKGAYRNGEQIHVSNNTSLETAVVESDMPSDREARKINLTILSSLNLYSFMRGSLVLNGARVAAGSADLYFVTKFGGPWDIAAATSIMQEAGGVAFDLEGNDLTNKKGSFLAKTIVFGNRGLVERFIEATRPILA